MKKFTKITNDFQKINNLICEKQPKKKDEKILTHFLLYFVSTPVVFSLSIMMSRMNLDQKPLLESPTT